MAKYDGAQSLPGALIGRIEGIVKSVCPDAVFEYDEASMMNVKADDIERDKSFVYRTDAIAHRNHQRPPGLAGYSGTNLLLPIRTPP
mgnify:CR=1 FL=1